LTTGTELTVPVVTACTLTVTFDTDTFDKT